jgi:hypothetical protein
LIQKKRPALHRKFHDLAELIMRTKNYDAMVGYLGGLGAFNVLISVPTAS